MSIVFESQHASESERTSFTSRSVARLSSRELGVGLAGLLCWLVTFAAGILIASPLYLKRLSHLDDLGFGQAIAICIIAFASYTVTNVAVLCSMASLLGGLYRRATKGPGNSISMYFLPYLIQGFVVFLLLISGMLLISEDPFTGMTQSKYIRLAGSASLFSFIAGHDPRLFVRMLERMDRFTQGSHGEKAPPH